MWNNNGFNKDSMKNLKRILAAICAIIAILCLVFLMDADNDKETITGVILFNVYTLMGYFLIK